MTKRSGDQEAKRKWRGYTYKDHKIWGEQVPKLYRDEKGNDMIATYGFWSPYKIDLYYQWLEDSRPEMARAIIPDGFTKYATARKTAFYDKKCIYAQRYGHAASIAVAESVDFDLAAQNDMIASDWRKSLIYEKVDNRGQIAVRKPYDGHRTRDVLQRMRSFKSSWAVLDLARRGLIARPPESIWTPQARLFLETSA